LAGAHALSDDGLQPLALVGAQGWRQLRQHVEKGLLLLSA
jgi:hypothetical protein